MQILFSWQWLNEFFLEKDCKISQGHHKSDFKIWESQALFYFWPLGECQLLTNSKAARFCFTRRTQRPLNKGAYAHISVEAVHMRFHHEVISTKICHKVLLFCVFGDSHNNNDSTMTQISCFTVRFLRCTRLKTEKQNYWPGGERTAPFFDRWNKRKIKSWWRRARSSSPHYFFQGSAHSLYLGKWLFTRKPHETDQWSVLPAGYRYLPLNSNMDI